MSVIAVILLVMFPELYLRTISFIVGDSFLYLTHFLALQSVLWSSPIYLSINFNEKLKVQLIENCRFAHKLVDCQYSRCLKWISLNPESTLKLREWFTKKNRSTLPLKNERERTKINSKISYNIVIVPFNFGMIITILAHTTTEWWFQAFNNIIWWYFFVVDIFSWHFHQPMAICTQTLTFQTTNRWTKMVYINVRMVYWSRWQQTVGNKVFAQFQI